MTLEVDQKPRPDPLISILLLICGFLLAGGSAGSIAYFIFVVRFPTDVQVVVWTAIAFITSLLACLCTFIALRTELKTTRHGGRLWASGILFGFDLLLLVLTSIPAGFILMLNLRFWIKK